MRRLVLLLVLAGCAPDPASGPDPSAPSSETERPTVGPDWDLVALGDTPVLASTRPTLTFTDQPHAPEADFDTFGGYTGCNWFGGGYRLDGETLTTDGEVAATERGCQPEIQEQEARYLDALGRMARVGRDGDRLDLLGADGVLLLSYRLRPERSVDVEALRRGRWRLDGGDVEVAFADSTFSGSTDCFTFEGTYVLQGDDLRVTSSRMLDRTCPPDQITPVPIGGETDEIAVDDRRLVLYDVDGAEVVFVRP